MAQTLQPAPVTLTATMAEQLQDMLMDEYLDQGFQERLHRRFVDAGGSLVAQAAARQAVCLPIQSSIVSLFGFEASRAGVAKCVRTFDTQCLNELFPDIADRSDCLSWLVKPEEQMRRPMPARLVKLKEKKVREESQRLAARTRDDEVMLGPQLASFDLAGIACYIVERECRRVVVMCGAGISTSAGIPDFRSPGTGLYDNLQRFDLPSPESIFDLSYFRRNPAPFYELAREIWPGNYRPTPTHYFIRLLHDKGILLRCYSQNIDSLERQAGLPPEQLVAAHGNFDAAHVIDTEPEVRVDVAELRAALEVEGGWQALQQRMGNLVKPTMVFFGEELPARWAELHDSDLKSCDVLIVLGTSLAVQPFSDLVGLAPLVAPRLLINKEPVGTFRQLRRGFRFCEEDNWRDVWLESDCDRGCRELAQALGWGPELEVLIESQGVVSLETAPWATPASEGVARTECWTGERCGTEDPWDPWGSVT